MANTDQITTRLGIDRARLLRYAAVSGVAVVVGQGFLILFYGVFGMPAALANGLAASLGAIPSYLLNRYWVWDKRSKNLFWSEIVPFWAITIIGLVLSTVAVAIVANWTDKIYFIVAASLAAYGVVWIGKFFILEHLMFGRDERQLKAAEAVR